MERDLVAGLIEGEELAAEVAGSAAAFDLNLPLTEEEMSLLSDQFDVSRTPSENAPRDLEDELYTYREKPSASAVASTPSEYSAEYLAYLRWQEIAAIGANDAAWLAFQELVLLPFVKRLKVDDENYRGHDPNEAFSLRLRYRTAKEFLTHILSTVGTAGEVQQPVLIGK